MKLLIVEDEQATREGMLQLVDWKSLGILEVQSAENGEQGIQISRRFRPDIVMTDVRMPRMGGIEMAVKLRSFLPACRIIFVSAYSDKAYYKAAIRLKAVSYLEKPISIPELEQVVSEAVAESRELRRREQTELRQMQQDLQQVAASLTLPGNRAECERTLGECGWKETLKTHRCITTLLVKLRAEQEADGLIWRTLAEAVEQMVEPLNLRFLCVPKHADCLVLHLFSPAPLHRSTLQLLCNCIGECLAGLYPYHISVGLPAEGIAKAYESYHSAVIVQQQAFYEPFGAVLFAQGEREAEFAPYDDQQIRRAFAASVQQLDQEAALREVQGWYEQLKTVRYPIVSKVKATYYELIAQVFQAADSRHLPLREGEEQPEQAWISVVAPYNLDELHNYLTHRLTQFFSACEDSRSAPSRILMIKDYISKHYADSLLSVKTIGDAVSMSASHLCVVFKRETGVTVNQYLTDLRIERAKQYLQETTLSAAEIGARVGYKDNSYFGRIFRKTVGKTPNEYREEWNQ
ncbi:response regulator receiver domain protein [[Clostridium] methylpentosum DSM 5476]|uniref:Stage 0 sporulation protein A homolog n=1 Tax=[Clostridium] methylpentosum DSM 5476 TaxID=537013 RepID=C0EGK3_9FIRM|nr:response regulator receiver domain protein [[Clostridium] methylpentosum DSM 5476]MEE1492181.1 response regulator [Massilioclostridium sp.]